MNFQYLCLQWIVLETLQAQNYKSLSKFDPVAENKFAISEAPLVNKPAECNKIIKVLMGS